MHNVGAFNITAPQQGGYHLYIGAGPERNGSVRECVAALGGAPVISIDLKQGGYNHDITSPPVMRELQRLADDSRCLTVLGSISCKTWSPARSVPGEGVLAMSKPLRDLEHREGFTDAENKLPIAVRKAIKRAS